MKPHKRNGRAAKLRRQESAKQRKATNDAILAKEQAKVKASKGK